MPLLAFAGVYLLPLFAMAGLAFGGAWTWSLPAVAFGLIPLLEAGIRGNHRNAGADEEAARRSDPRFDWLLYLAVPLQFGLLTALAWTASRVSPGELAGNIASVGICCGAFGINVAHELGHRANRREQRLAELLLLSSLYMHFFIEHNRGHHARVATPDDPASARLGEGIVAFWARSIVGSWRSAWRLEADRTHGRAWTWDNTLVRYLAVEVGTVSAALIAFGPVGALAFLGAATVGILLLETVNYVEHYGLSRARVGDRWERVRPAHSWTSDRPLSRVLLFDLTRHADHHAHPGRPYTVLRHYADAPQLPTGYAGMVLLALVPPLFHAIMDPRVEREAARLTAA